jgi:hypothetical protein
MAAGRLGLWRRMRGRSALRATWKRSTNFCNPSGIVKLLRLSDMISQVATVTILASRPCSAIPHLKTGKVSFTVESQPLYLQLLCTPRLPPADSWLSPSRIMGAEKSFGDMYHHFDCLLMLVNLNNNDAMNQL